MLNLLPEVGVDLYDEAFFHPAVDDGLHYGRLVVGHSEVHHLLFRERYSSLVQHAVGMQGFFVDIVKKSFKKIQLSNIFLIFAVSS